MSGHTPGPWSVEGRAILAGESRKRKLVADVYNGHRECKPNARLIAASPCLFSELNVAVDQAEAQFKVGDTHATFNRQTVAQWKAAIAKAEGKQ